MFNRTFQRLLSSAILVGAISSSAATFATEVTFDVTIGTSQGTIIVNLFDLSTPATVANFLSYVDNGDYTNTVIHRSISGFITQGGGFRFEGNIPLTPAIDGSLTSVVNEPVWSNRRGTIAMAKVGGNANSATNQWFFNLNNNSTNLDLQNGGFTVFGQVSEGMDIIDTIAAISTCSEIPMPEFDCANGGVPGVENFVTINSITVSDSSESTASNLTPVENTLIDIVPVVPEKSGGGGSLSWFSLLMIGLFSVIRKK